MIDSLIDKRDTFEIIRDQIALILASETANQQALATAAGEDPADWELKIYEERANPWEAFQDAPATAPPIINVWFETASLNSSASNVMERQDMRGTFNVDCYAYASATESEGGHVPGDEAAALAAHKAARLVRNILSAATYTYLGLQGTVNEKRITNVTAFQPAQQTNSMQQVLAVRLTLTCRYNEFSPQVEGTSMEFLHIDTYRLEDGSLYFDLDYDYT